MTDIPAEVVERCIAVVRAAATENWVEPAPKYVQEARVIAALLPEPVDPDIQLAREIAAETYEGSDNTNPVHRAAWARFMRGGHYDTDMAFRSAFAAIKRVRQ